MQTKSFKMITKLNFTGKKKRRKEASHYFKVIFKWKPDQSSYIFALVEYKQSCSTLVMEFYCEQNLS